MLDKTGKWFFPNWEQNKHSCRIVPKNVKGGPFGLYYIYSVAKYQKPRRGDSFERSKNFQKKSHNAEKNEEGDPLVSSGFVGC